MDTYGISLEKYSRISKFPLKVCYATWRESNRYVHVGIPIKFVSICFTIDIQKARYSVDWNGDALTIHKGESYLKIAYPGEIPVTLEQSARSELYLYYAPEARAFFDSLQLQSCRFVPTERFDRILEELHGVTQNPEKAGNTDILDRLCLDLALEAQICAKLEARKTPVKNIRRMEAYLKSHFADKIEFEEFARSHGMTPRTFYREWGNHFSTTPLQYVMQLRLQKAT
jgi:hypothetical protein